MGIWRIFSLRGTEGTGGSSIGTLTIRENSMAQEGPGPGPIARAAIPRSSANLNISGLPLTGCTLNPQIRLRQPEVRERHRPGRPGK
jgi:hypothetical protein